MFELKPPHRPRSAVITIKQMHLILAIANQQRRSAVLVGDLRARFASTPSMRSA